MKYGSVCSGIEAATVAWHSLGWEPTWFAEIEKFPSAVLAHHYPNVPNLGDMTLIADMVKSGQVEAPDVLVGGTPCQAFSVAGLKNSLEDDRGQLSLEFVRLANEIDAARLIRGFKPAVIVWENVPGVLNTKDNAFGCFLGALSGEGCELKPAGEKWPNAGCVFGPQRQVAWRVLDAQYFGLAQRRKRVFVIASARTECIPEILFERKSLQRNTSQSGSERESIAESSKNGFKEAIGIGGITSNAAVAYEIFPILLARTNADGYVIHNHVFGIQGNIIGRGIKSGGNGLGFKSEQAPTLTTADRHGAIQQSIARYLTEIECERLQGFPDNYTNIPGATKENRYKALGNSMAIPVMQWIGTRIQELCGGTA